MKLKRTHVMLGALVVAVIFLLSACGPAGISVEEAEGIQSDVQDVKERVAALEDQLAGLEQADEDELVETAGETISNVMSELSSIASRLDDIESDLEPPEEPVAEEPPMDPAAPAPGGDDPAGF